MGLERVGADSVRFFLTGAGSHEGAQTDPDLSTGGYRSSTEIETLEHVDDGGIANVTVDFVSGANGPGAGTVTATGSSTLTWTAPGSSTPGDAVTIANGETRVLEDGADPSKYVRVTRTSATALSGSSVVEIADVYSNLLGMESTSSAERTSGKTVYRCLAMVNNPVGVGVEAEDISVWIEAVAGTVRGPSVFSATLAASGASTVGLSSGDFADWPDAGWAKIETSAAALREIVYYTSRTSTVLTVPAAGRGLCGTTAAAMGATDKVVPWCGMTFSVQAASSQPSGYFDNADPQSTNPSALTYRADRMDGGYTWGSLAEDEQVGIWLRYHVPAGAVATPAPPLHLLRVAFDTLRS